MIVDTSVIVAIFRREPDARLFVSALERSALSYLTAPSFVELCMVLVGNREDTVTHQVDRLLAELGIKIIPFGPEMANVATQAFIKFGKGRGHPAQLNFGDCISYAASKVEAMPLLFKGNDFRLTDVEAAL